MLLGYSTWGMPTVPIATAVAHLAALGFDGLELTVIPNWTTELSTLDAAERRRLRDLLARHHLALPAIAGHTSLLAEDPRQHAANMARLRGAVELCPDLAPDGQVPALNTTVGATPADWDRLRGLLVDRLGQLAAHAARHGVTLAIEPHVGSMLDRPERVIWLIKQVNSPRVRVNFDISHFNVVGLPIEETVPLLAPLSVHTHDKDERGVVPNYEFLIPGEGEFDYVRYLRAMQVAGYTGFITVEVSLMVQRRPDYDPLAAADRSYAVLSRAFEVAGVPRSRPAGAGA
jgi:inosose dehydratase